LPYSAPKHCPVLQVLLDGNIIFQAVRTGVTIYDALVKILHTDQLELFVPASVLEELKELGKVGEGALAEARQMPSLPDAPTTKKGAAISPDGSAASSSKPGVAAAPAAGIMHLTREGNPDQYIVASMDTRLRAKLRKGGRTPTLYMNQNVFIMEPLPTGRTVEGAAPAPTAPPQKQGDAPPLTTAAAAAGEGGSAVASNIITSAGAPKAKVGGRKRGPSGPNPLSQKKPKKKPRAEVDAEAGTEQKKRNRRRKKTDAAAGDAPATAAATAAAAAE